MHRNILMVLLCKTFFYWIAEGQGAKQPTPGGNVLVAVIDKILRAQVDSNKIPGAVIEIKQGGKVIYEQAYGWAQKFDFNHRELSSPEKMTTAHLFDIASLTKVVGTTTAIMLLSDRGFIKIDDPVGKYIKAFDTGEKNDHDKAPAYAFSRFV
jgi:CubicO group peptidase (beta-lactamase class C family)